MLFCCNSFSYMNYGKRLYTARKHAGFSQKQLADAIKNACSQENISKLERSDASGSEYTAQFANACGVRAMWLAAEQGDMVDGYYVDDPKLKAALQDPRRVNALLLMESLPDYAVDHVVKEITETQELINQAGQGKAAAA